MRRTEDEASALSDVVGNIYGAVLHPREWSMVLERCCAFVGGVSANIFWQHAAADNVVDLYAWNEDLHYRELYAETYSKLNPFLPALARLEPGEVFSGDDLMPRDEFLASRFYKEWVRPQGWVDVLGANLDRSPTSFAMFSLRRGVEHGVVDDEAKRRMRLIVPHVRRAALIGELIDQKTLLAETLSNALSGMSSAVFLVDGVRRLVYANEAGWSMLMLGAVLRQVHDRLTVLDPAADAALGKVVGELAGPAAAVGSQGIAVPLTASLEEPWLATVLPLSDHVRLRADVPAAAVAAIFVREARTDIDGAVGRAAAQHKLSPAETRVLRALLDAGGLTRAASELGLSRSTAKSHLERIFSKTGSHSQAELVKRVLGFEPNPARGK